MGKSPAKWIKSILLGKKSLKSHGSKGRESSKATAQHGKGSAAPDSPVISQPMPVNTERSAMKTEKRQLSSTTDNHEVVPPRNQDVVTMAFSEKSTTEKIREEHAAVKAQAAFRGYLARRAFRALRGIIRLQALIRGHLVRRQASATLRCIEAIVKLQSLVRGQKDSKQTRSFGSSQMVIISSNAFVCKFVSTKHFALPLQMHYAHGEPNSAWNWLERWTRSLFWKPLTQPNKTVADHNSQQRNSGYAMETESVKSKRTLRRNVTANSESFGPTSITTKRNFRKVPSLPAETVQEHPQGELEKVKRNLRKISNSVSQPSSDQAEIETDKPKNSVKRPSVLAAEVPGDENVISAERTKKNNVAAVSTSDAKPEVEFYSKPAHVSKHNEADLDPSPKTDLHIKTKKSCSEIELNMDVVQKHGEVDISLNTNNDNLEAKLQPPLNENEFFKGKSQASLKSEKTSNEEEVCQENKKTNKRRVSLSTKPEYKEDGVQKAPNLPSYMAATKSAKAKLSPRRLSSDGTEKYSPTRRHSLPSATNGKLSSAQTQRPVAVNGRVVKSDKSLGHDKPTIQVEWRR